MSDLYNVVGTATYKNILADPQGADVIGVPCEPGAGVIPAGTVVYRKSSGLWAAAATANVVATNQLAVLKEDVDTGAASNKIAADAAAYRAGIFIDGVVTLASAAALSDANKAVLRGQGIVFDKKEAVGTFKNNTEE